MTKPKLSLTDADAIPRSTLEAADFAPDWRHQICSQYIARIAASEDETATLNTILEQEKDATIKEYLRFHSGCGGSSVGAIQYALSCQRSPAGRRMGAQIQAMVIAGRTEAEIAEDCQTLPEHIEMYEKLYFDVRANRQARAWLAGVCFPNGGPTSMQNYWLIVGYERGWKGLASIVLRPLPLQSYETVGKRARDGALLGWNCLLSDHIRIMEMSGQVVNVQTLRTLSEIVRRLEKTEGLSSLDQPERNTYQKEEKEKEAAKVAAQYSPAQRKKIQEAYMKVRALLAQPDRPQG